jgi:hypothetical protein
MASHVLPLVAVAIQEKIVVLLVKLSATVWAKNDNPNNYFLVSLPIMIHFLTQIKRM